MNPKKSKSSLNNNHRENPFLKEENFRPQSCNNNLDLDFYIAKIFNKEKDERSFNSELNLDDIYG